MLLCFTSLNVFLLCNHSGCPLVSTLFLMVWKSTWVFFFKHITFSFRNDKLNTTLPKSSQIWQNLNQKWTEQKISKYSIPGATDTFQSVPKKRFNSCPYDTLQTFHINLHLNYPTSIRPYNCNVTNKDKSRLDVSVMDYTTPESFKSLLIFIPKEINKKSMAAPNSWKNTELYGMHLKLAKM